MHADHEMQTGQRMPEETTMDMTRRYPVRHKSWDAVWGAAVQGGTRLSLGRIPCRRHRLTCRCSACGVMPSAARSPGGGPPCHRGPPRRRAAHPSPGMPRSHRASASACGARCPRPRSTRSSSTRATDSPMRRRTRRPRLRSHRCSRRGHRRNAGADAPASGLVTVALAPDGAWRPPGAGRRTRLSAAP